jgi:hypothetical protein
VPLSIPVNAVLTALAFPSRIVSQAKFSSQIAAY